MFPTSTAVPPTFGAFMVANDLTHDHPNIDGWRKVWQNELRVEATTRLSSRRARPGAR